MEHRRSFLWRVFSVVFVLALVLPVSIALAQDVPAQTGVEPVVQGSVMQQISVTATVNTTAYIRSGPGAAYGSLGGLPGGTTVPVLGRNYARTWLFIEYNGLRGWVATWLCSINGDLASVPVTNESGSSDGGGTNPPPTAPPSQPGGPVTATARSGVNIRSGPGTGYKILGFVPGRTTLPVNGRTSNRNWIFIDFNGMQGWSAAWLFTINGNLASVPVTSASGSGGNPPSSPAGFELGGQVPGSIGYGDQMRSAKMTWAKYQVVWTPGMNPAATSGYINDAHSKGFKVLLSITGPLYPSGIDYNSYVGFVHGVASLGADGIEIWNEMNLDREWPYGQINPSSYVNNMLKPAYQAIKSANPNTLVITGALAPTGVHNGVSVWSDDFYLAGMRDAGAASYMDCLGAHHNAGATSPDATSGHPADGGGRHYSWYYKPTYDLYSGAFPKSKLCFTELGYLSPEGYGGLPPNFWWAFDTSVSEHAQWLARATTLARTSGRVRLVIVFNVGFAVWTDDPQAGYSIIRPGGYCPACSTLAGAMP